MGQLEAIYGKVLNPMLSPKFLRRGGSSFDFATLGTRVLGHYSARDTVTLGPTDAGPGAIVAGGQLGYVADKSPNGLHLRRVTSGQRIKYALDGNGRPCFFFDGTKNISLQSAAINWASHSKITVFLVVSVDATDAALKIPFYFKPESSAGSFTALASNSKMQSRLHNGTNQHEITKATGAVSTSPKVYAFTFVPGARRQHDAAAFSIDNVEWDKTRESVTDAAGVTGGTFGTGTLQLGNWGSNNFAWEGNIYELILVAGDLSEAEFEGITKHCGDIIAAPYPPTYKRLQFSHANDYRKVDSLDGWNAYAYSTLYYDTAATSVDIEYHCSGVIANYVNIGIEIDGEYFTQVVPPGAGVFTATVALPPGSKRVGIMNSACSGNSNGPGAEVSSRIRNVVFNGPSTPHIVAAAAKLLIYGDSVATGGHGYPILQNAWPLILRRTVADVDVSVYAESSRTFKTDYESVGFGGGLRDSFVEIVRGYNPQMLIMAIGINDYGLAQWNATAFGVAYAQMLDNLHTALPDMSIACQSPLNGAHGTAPNAVGSTLQDYRDVIEAACVGREDWAFYIDGRDIITNAAAELTDGVHPNVAGNIAYAAFIAGNL